MVRQYSSSALQWVFGFVILEKRCPMIAESRVNPNRGLTWQWQLHQAPSPLQGEGWDGGSAVEMGDAVIGAYYQFSRGKAASCQALPPRSIKALSKRLPNPSPLA